ncbi:MAG: type II toxin-antitoxin system RelE/ParE family toxin [Nitrososphaeria archaeon]|nr:type II toxin-antitoxin system RelE/ParE family toxin [Nitrososphaeria archaeon]
MRIFYTEEFRKDIKKIKEKDILERLKRIIQQLKETPEMGKPLRYRLAGLRSIKMGKLRIIYRIEEDKIILLKIGHRKTVYKS